LTRHQGTHYFYLFTGTVEEEIGAIVFFSAFFFFFSLFLGLLSPKVTTSNHSVT